MWNNVIERQCDRLKKVESAIRGVSISEPNVLRFSSDLLGNKDDAAAFIAENIPKDLKDFVYFFKVEPAIDMQRLEHFYPAIRKELHWQHRYLSNLNKAPSSDCLFVGSRRSNLRNIVMQHLGFGADRTFSLKLSYWYTAYFESDIYLQYHQVEGEDLKTSLALLERGAWESMKPAFGSAPLGIS